MNLMHLGAMLRECRGDRSIKSTAKQLKISARTYRLIELSRRRPQIRTCYILAGFLGKPGDEILALAGYTVPGGKAMPTQTMF
jgi:transcriptional regulator with XRE-family HTH domain